MSRDPAQEARALVSRLTSVLDGMSPDDVGRMGSILTFAGRSLERLDTDEHIDSLITAKLSELTERGEELESTLQMRTNEVSRRLRIGAADRLLDTAVRLSEITVVVSSPSPSATPSLALNRVLYTDAFQEERAAAKLNLVAAAVCIICAFGVGIWFIIIDRHGTPNWVPFLALAVALFSLGVALFIVSTRRRRAASIYFERDNQARILGPFLEPLDKPLAQAIRASLAPRFFPRSPYDSDIIGDPVYMTAEEVAQARDPD